ncbi:MAG: hypothetical protein HYW90_02490 [Candidatus Sungbacteria bacterium]|nr:hypothetical protein [Candidatus Sungbacteria bacterium]
MQLGKVLEQLFESRSKISALKLFLMNPGAEFSIEKAVASAQINKQRFQKEIKKLLKIGLVGTRIAKQTIELPRKTRRGKKTVKPKLKTVRERVFFANKEFVLYPELKNLVSRAAPSVGGGLTERIRSLGDIKVALLSGVFIKSDSSLADIMLVGDKLKKDRINSFLKKLRADTGKELNYSVMTTPEFRYRLDMNDRFVRDVLDSPHEKIINKLGI